MPLTPAGLPGVFDSNREGIGFWMTVKQDGEPDDQVRVFVTCRALEEMDPSAPQDRSGAFATFDSNRDLVEAKASAKFDKEGADTNDLFEGKPTLTLRAPDLGREN